MPTLKDLLDAKRAAVVALEEKQRGYELALDELNAARRRVEAAWCAAAGGVALAHANEDSAFRDTFTTILNERLNTKRDRKLLDEWKAGPPPAPDQTPDTSSTNTGKTRRARRREQDLDLETVSGAELLENVKQLETDVKLLEKEVADAKAGADQVGRALRRRDDHWRIKVGETILAHADDNAAFRDTLDQIFEQRIAQHHRALLDRWRNRSAPGATPPPAVSPHRGWKPRMLADGSWGAAFPEPASKSLPAPLVGAAIVVRTNKGDEWITEVKEVIEQSNTSLVVRTAGRQDTVGTTRSAAPPAANENSPNENSPKAPEKSAADAGAPPPPAATSAPEKSAADADAPPPAAKSTTKAPEKSLADAGAPPVALADAAVKKPVE